MGFGIASFRKFVVIILGSRAKATVAIVSIRPLGLATHG